MSGGENDETTETEVEETHGLPMDEGNPESPNKMNYECD